MLFSQNPVSGVVECYSDDGEFMGNMSTMGDFFIGKEEGIPAHEAQDGGPGSGNFGHEGRPGEIGGSGKGSGSSGLNSSYCRRDGLKPFNDKIKSESPEAFGDESGINERVEQEYRRMFGTSLFLHENYPDEYPIVSYEEYKDLDFQDKIRSVVPYEEYKKGVLEENPHKYASPDSVINGLVLYERGAREDGYGKGKGARLSHDEKYKISDFIDSHPGLHYEGGTVYRGIRTTKQGLNDLKKAAETGETISMRGPSSWTTEREIAEDFTQYSLRGKGNQQRVIFRESGEKERDAIPFPYSSQRLMPQHEVIYSGAARFKVTGVTESGGITYVDVQSE